MRPNAFTNHGRFFRGNLHTHSNRSDGKLDDREVCRRYKAQGYDFIALTDHFVGHFDYPISDTRGFRDQDFTTIIGAELHSGGMANGELWHILAVGLPFDFAPSNTPTFQPIADQETGPEIARRAVAAGAFVAVAHPEWSGLSEADALSIEAAHAVEIYNHGCHVECDRGRGFHTADHLAKAGRRLNFIATDDAHFAYGNKDAFGGWVMVKAEENSPEALLAALKAGAMYSSTGPDLVDISVIGDQVDVRSSAVVGMIVQGQGVGTASAFGDSMTTASIDCERLSDSPWIRVTVFDAAGRAAWSNPIWRD